MDVDCVSDRSSRFESSDEKHPLALSGPIIKVDTEKIDPSSFSDRKHTITKDKDCSNGRIDFQIHIQDSPQKGSVEVVLLSEGSNESKKSDQQFHKYLKKNIANCRKRKPLEAIEENYCVVLGDALKNITETQSIFILSSFGPLFAEWWHETKDENLLVELIYQAIFDWRNFLKNIITRFWLFWGEKTEAQKNLYEEIVLLKEKLQDDTRTKQERLLSVLREIESPIFIRAIGGEEAKREIIALCEDRITEWVFSLMQKSFLLPLREYMDKCLQNAKKRYISCRTLWGTHSIYILGYDPSVHNDHPNQDILRAIFQDGRCPMQLTINGVSFSYSYPEGTILEGQRGCVKAVCKTLLENGLRFSPYGDAELLTKEFIQGRPNQFFQLLKCLSINMGGYCYAHLMRRYPELAQDTLEGPILARKRKIKGSPCHSLVLVKSRNDIWPVEIQVYSRHEYMVKWTMFFMVVEKENPMESQILSTLAKLKMSYCLYGSMKVDGRTVFREIVTHEHTAYLSSTPKKKKKFIKKVFESPIPPFTYQDINN